MDANEYEGLSKSNASKFRSYYENEYKTLYPPPILHIVGLDWKFYGSVIVSVFTVILASLRTAQMFYFAAETSSRLWGLGTTGTGLLSGFDALSAMIAVEGGISLGSAIKTSRSGTVDESIYFWQVGLLLLISIIAGFGQSLGLVTGIDRTFLLWFSYLLVFVLGIGASVAAWFAGEILGVQLQKFSIQRFEAEQKYSEEMKFYSQNARKFWKLRTEEEKETEREQKRIDRTTGIPVPQRNFPRTQNRTSTGKVPIIFSEIEKFWAEQNRVPSFSELAEILRREYPEQNFSSSGYISTIRKQWIEENTEKEAELDENPS